MGHYRHGVRFIESRHEIDVKVVKSSQMGDACRLKHYRWVNKHAMSRQRRLKHTPWHRQSSVNHCLHVGAKNPFHNFPYFIIDDQNFSKFFLFFVIFETSSDCDLTHLTWNNCFDNEHIIKLNKSSRNNWIYIKNIFK